MLMQTFKTTGSTKVFFTYLIFYLITSLLICFFEPGIETVSDSLWYCFAVATTVGLGDYTSVTLPGRILTIVLSIYSIGVIAIFTAVITSFFTSVSKSEASESASHFIDDITHLSELSKEEIESLQKRIHNFLNR